MSDRIKVETTQAEYKSKAASDLIQSTGSIILLATGSYGSDNHSIIAAFRGEADLIRWMEENRPNAKLTDNDKRLFFADDYERTWYRCGSRERGMELFQSNAEA